MGKDTNRLVMMTTVGTYGDILPFLGIGRALRARGFRVRLQTNEYFRDMVLANDLEFDAIASRDDYQTLLREVHVKKPVNRTLLIDLMLLGPMRRSYALIEKHHVPGKTVLLAFHFAMGPRLAQEKLGIPLVTAYLTSLFIPSRSRPMPLMPVPALMPPTLLRRIGYKNLELYVDWAAGRDFNRFRDELGLPPQKRIVRWLGSPQRGLGLFPDWFYPPPGDWSDNLKLTGFPYFDLSETRALDPDLEAFLDDGPPPIVFTPGTPQNQGARFFKAATEAVEQLGARAIFLTMHREHVPEKLPERIRHYDYLPFSQVLPRAAAFVHHCGVGSIAQALKAGVPQLGVPWWFDQPVNARCLEKLGVASVIPFHKVTAKRLVTRLEALMTSPRVRSRCDQLSREMRERDPLDDACREIEEVFP